MPPKGKRTFRKTALKARKRVDKAQNSRIKELEQFVYKTIENKQIDFTENPSITTAGYNKQINFVPTLAVGADDGGAPGDAARIGNTVTLMRTAVNMLFKMSAQGLTTSEQTNRFRVIMVASKDGTQPLIISDVLTYWSHPIHGDQVFVSPYKTNPLPNKNYTILMDKIIDLNATDKFYKNVKFVKRWKGGKTLNYSGPGASAPTNYNISMFVISDSGSLPHPSLDWNSRCTYKDA